MAALAATARRAATAIVEGDLDGLAGTIDATFDLRATLYDLEPAHLEMIEVARREGAAANYPGSGGSIVALCADDTHAISLRRALAAIAGCVVIGPAQARSTERTARRPPP